MEKKHPIPIHYKLFMYKAWLGMLWYDILCFHNFKRQRNVSNVVYKTIRIMAQTHGVKPYDGNLSFWLIMFASFILTVAFLLQLYVKFYQSIVVI